jgi:hypothetical protein
MLLSPAFIRQSIEDGTFPALSTLHSNSWEVDMAKKAVKAPAAQLSQSLIFNPHILWDPPPWQWIDQLGPGAAQELARINLQHQKEVLASQAKAVDQALALVNKSRG